MFGVYIAILVVSAGCWSWEDHGADNLGMDLLNILPFVYSPKAVIGSDLEYMMSLVYVNRNRIPTIK